MITKDKFIKLTLPIICWQNYDSWLISKMKKNIKNLSPFFCFNGRPREQSCYWLVVVRGCLWLVQERGERFVIGRHQTSPGTSLCWRQLRAGLGGSVISPLHVRLTKPTQQRSDSHLTTNKRKVTDVSQSNIKGLQGELASEFLSRNLKC